MIHCRPLYQTRIILSIHSTLSVERWMFDVRSTFAISIAPFPKSRHALPIMHPNHSACFSRWTWPKPLSLLSLVLTCLWLHGAAPAALPAPEPNAVPRYDLILRHGKIIDGTGNPWFIGDVAVRGDKIAALGRSLRGQADKELDARGLIVAPGFIDMHSHSDWLVLEDGHAQSKIRQGVTTEILGEGSSPGPFQGKLAPHPVSAGNQAVRIASLKNYFDTVEKAGVAVNLGSYVGLDNIWQCVMGQSFDPPSAEDLEKMKRLVAQAMDEGALGLSSMLMMPPGSLATTEHLVALCRIVRDKGGIFSSHIRDEGLGVFDSVKQIIEVARQADVPADIIHLKIADHNYWGRMNEVVALIASARHQGINVQANVYPYTRGNNNLSSIIPPWAHEGGTKAMLDRLRDPAQRTRLKHDIQNGLPGWYNHYTAVGNDWSRMLISEDNAYKGMTMDQVLVLRTANKNPKPDPLDVLFDLLIEENGSVGTVYAHHTEKDMNLALVQPWCSIGSDGSAFATEGLLRRGHPHPRNFGTFPRVLGRYTREQTLLPLEDAVRKMTSLNATKVGLKDRGFLRENAYADITVFDETRILDQSTFTDPFHYNAGIVYVLVNGQVVLDHDKHTGAKPGRALRHGAE